MPAWALSLPMTWLRPGLHEGGSTMIPRSAILVALFAFTAALAVPALASGASAGPKAPVTSTEAKVTVGSLATPYLPNGSNEPALAMDANHPAVLAAGANDLVDSAPCQGSSC